MKFRSVTTTCILVISSGLSLNTVAIKTMPAAASTVGFVQGYKGFSEGYCTNYAARKFDQAAPEPKHNWRGNAGDWVANASRAKWRVSTTQRDAQANALIVWQDGGFGHVGVVESLDGDHINISEMNWGKIVDQASAKTVNFNKVTNIRLPISNLNRGKYRFVGYIFPTQFVGPMRPR